MKKLLVLTVISMVILPVRAQLQNPDFEVWTPNPENPEVYNIAQGWTRTNSLPIFSTGGFYFDAPADAQQGNHALKMCVWNHSDKDEAYQMAPIDYRPSALTGFYKYILNSVIEVETGNVIEDYASVRVYVTKSNEVIGTGHITLGSSENYTAFVCPITYSSNETPDYIKIMLDCSVLTINWETWLSSHSSAFDDGISSIFTVDNLQLEANLGISDFSDNDVVVYPNPVSDKLFVSGFEGALEIYDLMGKLIIKHDYIQSSGINVSALQSGCYVVKLTNDEKTFITKVLVR
ncbi:T9SS type A sorting domain-containing protein [Flavobacterium sp. ST-75]|uniref:T9SS type A sorting domain-containing protein n=1 Tax=Flavobacterium rhizophilum TaxID=3163296 RepID=A0ABW8YBR4_9FLAO